MLRWDEMRASSSSFPFLEAILEIHPPHPTPPPFFVVPISLFNLIL